MSLAQVYQVANGAAQMARQALQRVERLETFVSGMNHSKKGMGAADENGQEPDYPLTLAIEKIPGRRIPYDMVFNIPIPANTDTKQTASQIVTQEGPFVVCKRSAIFISNYEFQLTINEQNITYSGRSWGRQRPISSALDLFDSVSGWVDNIPASGEGCEEEDTPPAPAMVSRPASRSPFRTMLFDGSFAVGSDVYPRQNKPVPSGLWAPGFEGMFNYDVLDYFASGEIINVEVEPARAINANFGNIQALLGSMPFLAGQYDGHEGISYPSWLCEPSSSDPILRKPDGLLVLVLHGFRILHPPGVRLRQG